MFAPTVCWQYRLREDCIYGGAHWKPISSSNLQEWSITATRSPCVKIIPLLIFVSIFGCTAEQAEVVALDQYTTVKHGLIQRGDRGSYALGKS